MRDRKGETRGKKKQGAGRGGGRNRQGGGNRQHLMPWTCLLTMGLDVSCFNNGKGTRRAELNKEAMSRR